MYTVYCHTNKINGKKYVGITSRPVNKRWLNGKGYSTVPRFNKAIEKYGWDNFEHEILAENLTEEEAICMEISLIAGMKLTNCKYGYNSSDGGNTVSTETREKIRKKLTGHEISQSTRQKISESLKGRKIPRNVVEKASSKRRGRHLSIETKEKISDSLKGRKYSEETIEKIRQASMGNKNMLGKHHSEESRRKMSQSAAKRKVKNIKTGKIYNSIKEAAELELVTWGTIYWHCSGKAKNQKWVYFDKK